MSSYKRLKSVAHSFSHHSVSGLSWMHPHLAESCDKAGLSKIELDLLSDNILPNNIDVTEPLELSSNGLKERFNEMLIQEGFTNLDLQEATIEFHFNIKEWDYYTAECSTRLVMQDGRVIKKGVNVRGKSTNA
ncbi:hypothetical protein QNI23_007455 [Bermanella sp. WJH001]|uniref:hypothetical protein n=1 Tax=Bermanella sp. WJH001 TaxID=3048005 RepID=UPI0024BF0691|nr:hypothetical protein [Bermanella sp. WJH001]MDJ1536828.1 hypothetical protein [Bermanella sp. WJH001]